MQLVDWSKKAVLSRVRFCRHTQMTGVVHEFRECVYTYSESVMMSKVLDAGLDIVKNEFEV